MVFLSVAKTISSIFFVISVSLYSLKSMVIGISIISPNFSFPFFAVTTTFTYLLKRSSASNNFLLSMADFVYVCEGLDPALERDWVVELPGFH